MGTLTDVASLFAEQGIVVTNAEAQALAEQLARLYRIGAAAWPGVIVSELAFGRALVERLERDAADRATALGLLCVEDLYLIAACQSGDNAARTLFVSTYRPLLESAAARIELPSDSGAELVQQLLGQLLVGDGLRPALLAKYGGRGRLAAWLRVCAVHAALNRAQRGNQEVPVDDQVFAALPDPSYDPELRFLKETYREAFRQAFRSALAALDEQERAMLQLSYLDGLSIDQLAPIYGVHRATAARRLARARASLLRGTRTRLLSALAIDEGELDAIIGMIQSRLDFSFRSVVGDP